MGNALAISISSNCVKPCSCGGTGDGIIKLSAENFLVVLLSREQRLQTYFFKSLGFVFKGHAS